MTRQFVSESSTVDRDRRFYRLILSLSVALILTSSINNRANGQDKVANVQDSGAEDQDRVADKTIDTLGKALIQGNTGELIGLASGALDLAFDGESRVYSLAQARRVISDYLSDQQFLSFVVVDYKKTSRGWFIESKLMKPGGHAVRVYLRLIRSETKWFLRELFFETLGDTK